MLEARLNQAETLKKVLEAVKELVTDANFDCTDEGIKLQAMDNSHVALVSLHLNATGFSNYRCDRDMSLGMSLASLQKIIKCAGNNDVVTLRADESHDVLGLLFENKEHDRVGEYEMKLMDIDQEHLGIPDTVYDAEIMLPSAEFARIIRDLKELGESVKIEVSKDGVRFSSEGDIGSAAVTLKQTNGGGKDASDDEGSDEEQGSDEEEEEEEKEEEEEEEEPKEEEDEDVIIEDEKPEVEATAKEGSGSPAPKPSTADADAEDADEKPAIEIDSEDEEAVKKQVKKEKTSVKKEKGVKKEKKDTKKRKAPAPKKGKSSGSKEKKAKKEDTPRKVAINLQQAVSLTFSIKYLANFAKSTSLSDYVVLHMSNEVPLLVEYDFGQGHIRYYLAPKIAEE
ncbi:proliferating cell nuclear antigen, N-terminal domain-domain-containing protein [Leucosporidium creatinivorum]|uniref:DNA sliding clamp PCNA n=1 Tax=Leucosporidium creatinivorum TaxID=106004 RepID=A0A1Y2FVX6_9BASI|nr:proliferating cell nuclear antigen, N-terminal domain-domain-containing protein [Leucosporidium creatinivorum]